MNPLSSTTFVEQFSRAFIHIAVLFVAAVAATAVVELSFVPFLFSQFGPNALPYELFPSSSIAAARDGNCAATTGGGRGEQQHQHEQQQCVVLCLFPLDRKRDWCFPANVSRAIEQQQQQYEIDNGTNSTTRRLPGRICVFCVALLPPQR